MWIIFPLVNLIKTSAIADAVGTEFGQPVSYSTPTSVKTFSESVSRREKETLIEKTAKSDMTGGHCVVVYIRTGVLF